MSFINYHSKEINCKIVYCGPGLSGKTTNLQHIYNKTTGELKGNMISLTSENERTLFFDFLPLTIGEINGFNVRFHLYSIPGQNFFETSRKVVLRGVDGIVFVCDSQVEMIEANKEALLALERNLEEEGYDIRKIPMVFQYNKRDLQNITPVPELSKILNPHSREEFEAMAKEGIGVFEALKSVTKMILMELNTGKI